MLDKDLNEVPCDCGAQDARNIILPSSMKVPLQYQNVRFDSRMLPAWVDGAYGAFMSSLLRELTSNMQLFSRNLLVCSPPNTGKTVFAYTVNGILYGKGIPVAELRDVLEVREIFLNPYAPTHSEADSISKAKVVFIKIPMDLPNKLAETMSMIIERRVRNNGSTVFLFSGSKEDLLAQDRFGKLQGMLGDGAFNSIEVKSWFRPAEKEGVR